MCGGGGVFFKTRNNRPCLNEFSLVVLVVFYEAGKSYPCPVFPVLAFPDFFYNGFEIVFPEFSAPKLSTRCCCCCCYYYSEWALLHPCSGCCCYQSVWILIWGSCYNTAELIIIWCSSHHSKHIVVRWNNHLTAWGTFIR
uniref:Uncharacterized protein n=1 Tax=Cacopsylla melanoneura TaxID=428564 RepID=A0A8D8UPR3_9HEMI